MSGASAQLGDRRTTGLPGLALAGLISLGAHGAVGLWAWGELGRTAGPGDRDPALRDAEVTMVIKPRTDAAPAPVSTPAAHTPKADQSPAATTALAAGAGVPVAEPAPPAERPGTPVGLPGSSPTNWSSALSTPGATVTFAGLSASGSRARSVVYVVDASGPMVTTLPEVLAEVQRSVDGLAPTQRFGVVLFGEGLPGGSAAFERTLVDASPRQRGRLASWLAGAAPSGRSNPLDGLRAGLALRPQVVFLLSRSIERSGGGQWGAGLEATLAELERLNPVDPSTGLRPVIIKTVQFLEPDPTGTMQAIAAHHGGDSGERAAIVMRGGAGVKERSGP